ncbi:MAG: metallophosphoesterase family protein [bacterium]
MVTCSLRLRLPSLCALVVAAVSSAGRPALAGEPPDLRFVHLSDTHCRPARRNPRSRLPVDPLAKDLVRSFRLLEAAVEDINRHVKPDFAVVTGDLADRPNDTASLRRVKAILDDLQCPWYPVVGNHDGARAWTRVFGARRRNYVFRDKGWRFIALDSSRGRFTVATRAWLRRVLDADQATPTALLTHYPLVLPEAHKTAARRLYGAGRLVLADADDVLGLLSRHGNVKAVFAGHCHVPVTTREAGLAHHIAPALVTLGHHYAVVEAKGGRCATTYRAVAPGAATGAGRQD